MTIDDFALRRRLQRDLEALGKKHPGLKDPERQERLTKHLESEAEREAQDGNATDEPPTGETQQRN